MMSYYENTDNTDENAEWLDNPSVVSEDGSKSVYSLRFLVQWLPLISFSTEAIFKS